MKLASPIFNHNETIPAKYTCKGEDINPELHIEDIPENTQSLVLIVDDPDAPAGTANPGWVHWVVFNILPDTKIIQENSLPPSSTQGQNDFGRTAWGGPCPPSGTHRYLFKIYALDSKLNLNKNATKSDVEMAMQNHIIDSTHLVGLFSR
ncbi:YbhB/YbcL family Raf kinase inhibitor-like protein [Candidatus Saccharibacteria bacterium CPR2]|nr:YbhB/YbcL family Raf kinase inhibitor-like protein [Candidatus Saccharibacteria bacterium CPR2]